MPKGVEHWPRTSRGASPWLVPNSVMPKGVEHLPRLPLPLGVYAVPNSVMPKGVEHCPLWPTDPVARSAEFSDAERC